MFPGLSGLALPHPLAPVRHEPCTPGLVSLLPNSLWLAGLFVTLFPVALTTTTHKKYGPLPPPLDTQCIWSQVLLKAPQNHTSRGDRGGFIKICSAPTNADLIKGSL